MGDVGGRTQIEDGDQDYDENSQDAGDSDEVRMLSASPTGKRQSCGDKRICSKESKDRE